MEAYGSRLCACAAEPPSAVACQGRLLLKQPHMELYNGTLRASEGVRVVGAHVQLRALDIASESVGHGLGVFVDGGRAHAHLVDCTIHDCCAC